MNLTKTLAVATLSLTLTVPVLAFADIVSFSTDLNASSEVPPTDSSATGHFAAAFDTSTHQLHYDAAYADLTGAATMAHIHGPASVGKNAPVVIPVPKDKLASPIEDTVTLTNEQAKQLMAGNYYFNVHTAKNPGGEIRGQIVQVK
ncbi:CHRD domain-containing protein [Paraburkholderia sediminicola]|uniref:CHRD domain-containing protein n=1 Tax=Paraburkholderia sediminicola TaxID=458836 RepID=UPI0038BD76A0